MKKRMFLVLLVLLAFFFIAPVQGHAIETAPAESVSFYCHNQTGYVGLSDVLSVYFSPDGTEEAYTMTSSDESVVILEWSVFEHYTAYFLKPGTAIITVTTESGLTDQCTITVVEMESFTLNETKTVTIQPEDVLTFEFEYEEYGDYVFFATDDVDTPLKSETKDANIYYNLNRHYFTLDENSEFCRVSIYNDTDAPQTYTVKLMKAVPVESITLNVSRPAPYYVGEWIWIEAELHPENAKLENLSWTSSDTSVVDLDYWTWMERSADFLSVGNAIVTVTSESGATGSIEIPVSEPGVLYDSCTFDVNLAPDERIVYSFTPEESGEYVLYMDWDEELFYIDITILNSDTKKYTSVTNYNLYHSYGCEYSFKYFNLDAGNTYNFEIVNIADDKTISRKCHFYKTVPIEKMYFDVQQCSALYYSDWGGVCTINLNIEPIHAEHQQIDWEIDNESIVAFRQSVLDHELYAFLECLAPGSATLTASTDSGLSATCEITVYEYQYYAVVSGDRAFWEKNSEDGLQFEVNADPEKFEYMMWGASSEKIDPIYYTVTKGNSENSSIIDIHPDALKTLSLGTHYICITYSDGDALYGFTVVEENDPFTDVPEGSFYYDPVRWAVANNITTGATETTFNPTGDCLRAQVVTFLWRAAGCPAPTSAVNPFVDVKPSDFYYDAVLWAVEKGITNGADATHFNPMGVCNRAQVVTFLYRAFESPAVEDGNTPFTDVPAGQWYAAPVAWAVENEITNGLSATTFGPTASCNRAQIVTFLYRAYN